jgi:hypothetical protein
MIENCGPGVKCDCRFYLEGVRKPRMTRINADKKKSKEEEFERYGNQERKGKILVDSFFALSFIRPIRVIRSYSSSR